MLYAADISFPQFFAPYLWMSWIVIALVVWSFVWKGIALWKAARAGHKIWFVVLLIVNTAGILEILYIFIFSRVLDKNKTPEI